MGKQRAENLYRDLSKERGREGKSKSRGLSNRSLKTDGETMTRTRQKQTDNLADASWVLPEGSVHNV